MVLVSYIKHPRSLTQYQFKIFSLLNFVRFSKFLKTVPPYAFKPVQYSSNSTSKIENARFFSTQAKAVDEYEFDINVFSFNFDEKHCKEFTLTWRDQPKLMFLWEQSLVAWHSWNLQNNAEELDLREFRTYEKEFMNCSWDWFRLFESTIFCNNYEILNYKDFKPYLYHVTLKRFHGALNKMYILLRSSKQKDSAHKMKEIVFMYLLKFNQNGSLELQLSIVNRYCCSLMNHFINVENKYQEALCIMEEALSLHQKIDPYSVSKKHKFCPFLYSAAIKAWVALDRMDLAEKTYHKFEVSGNKPILITFNVFLAAYSKKRDYYNFLKWWQRFQKSSFRPSTFTLANILFFLGSNGKLKACKRIYQKWFTRNVEQKPLSEPNIAVYTIMLQSCIRSGDKETALSYFETILNSTIESDYIERYSFIPDSRFFATALDIFVNAKCTEANISRQEAESASVLYLFLLKNSFIDSEIFLRMIRLYGAQGRMSEAVHFLQHNYPGKSIEGCLLLYAVFLKHFGGSLKRKDLNKIKEAGYYLMDGLPYHSANFSMPFLRQFLFLELSLLLKPTRRVFFNQLIMMDQIVYRFILQKLEKDNFLNDMTYKIKCFTLLKLASRFYFKAGFYQRSSEFLEYANTFCRGNAFLLNESFGNKLLYDRMLKTSFKKDNPTQKQSLLLDFVGASNFSQDISFDQTLDIYIWRMKIYNESNYYDRTIKLYCSLPNSIRPTPPIFRLTLFALYNILHQDIASVFSIEQIHSIISKTQNSYRYFYPNSAAKFFLRVSDTLELEKN